MHFNSILSVSLLITAASAHFTLNFPPAIGFSEDDESSGPCGGFKATDRSKKVTDFPISGSSIAVLTTHPSVEYEFRAALLNDTDNFKSILPGLVSQKGMGDLCEPGVAIPEEWEGEDGVIQVVHRAKGEPFLFQVRKLLVRQPFFFPHVHRQHKRKSLNILTKKRKKITKDIETLLKLFSPLYAKQNIH